MFAVGGTVVGAGGKDFGSVLSMNRDARAGLLALLVVLGLAVDPLRFLAGDRRGARAREPEAATSA